MIEFIKFGKHDNMLGQEKREIEKAIIECNSNNSFYYWLNIIYNNSTHFYNSNYNYDITVFLKELERIAKSEIDKVIVMGGIHNDTGHTSGLIVQDIGKNEQIGIFVSDSYIRFRIELKHPKNLHVLNQNQIFHFIITVPTILWYPKPKGNIYVYNILNYITEEYARDLIPKSNTKNIKIYAA